MFGLATLSPVVSGLFRAVWKPVLGGVVVLALVLSFNAWKNDLVTDARKDGYEQAERKMAKAVSAANEKARDTQVRLDQMVIAFDAVSSAREQEINLTVTPQIQRIEHEIKNDPRYSECAVSDSLLGQLNAGRSAIDASVAASNPNVDQ